MLYGKIQISVLQIREEDELGEQKLDIILRNRPRNGVQKGDHGVHRLALDKVRKFPGKT